MSSHMKKEPTREEKEDLSKVSKKDLLQSIRIKSIHFKFEGYFLFLRLGAPILRGLGLL
jgi:hypothetical protein